MDGSDSSDPDGVIVSFDWDFGDGATASGKSADHVYAVPVRVRTRSHVRGSETDVVENFFEELKAKVGN